MDCLFKGVENIIRNWCKVMAKDNDDQCERRTGASTGFMSPGCWTIKFARFSICNVS